MAARLVEVLDGRPVSALARVVEQLDAVVDRLTGVAEGSGGEALWNAVELFATARRSAGEALQALEAAGDYVGVYMSVLGVDIEPESFGPTVAGSRHGVDRMHAVRAELPVWSPGAKTRGVWVEDHGRRHELLSGKHDQWYGLANRRAVELGLVPQGVTLTAASHVELKFATQMRRAGIVRATIAVNRRPCPGELGCHALIGQFLPDGAELTVYGPDRFVHTYRNDGGPR